jgi:hypothetical protein
MAIAARSPSNDLTVNAHYGRHRPKRKTTSEFFVLQHQTGMADGVHTGSANVNTGRCPESLQTLHKRCLNAVGKGTSKFQVLASEKVASGAQPNLAIRVTKHCLKHLTP